MGSETPEEFWQRIQVRQRDEAKDKQRPSSA